jgi:GT2 family glycosyltransferase/glycosyltransferase involved in cell wall biosynthesis
VTRQRLSRRLGGILLRAGQQHLGRHIPYPIRTRLRRMVGLPPKPRPWVTSEEGLLATTGALEDRPALVDIVCFPIIDWDFRFQRPQQLMRALAARGHRVFWIDPDSLLTGAHLAPGAAPQLSRIENGIFRVKPGMAEACNLYTDTLSEANQTALVDSLRELARREGISTAASIVQLPFWTDAALTLRDRGWRVLYDCMDDHEGFATNDAAMIAREKRLADDADAIVVTSRALAKKLAFSATPLHRIPNAGDFDHFANPSPDAPAGLPEIEGPVIGYFGAISAWFDFDLLRDAAGKHPEWTFLLIGSTFGAPEHADLEALPHVHFLGEKPYSELPAWLARFDVATIPFQSTPLIEATDPVKAYEYMAAGKPVVTSDLPELRPHGNLFQQASDPATFTRKLEEALGDSDAAVVAARRRFAQENSWQSRGAAMADIVNDMFPEVSIIIVTWNNLGFTRQCLDSLRANTSWPRWEVILVDNGSTDETPAYLAELAASDPRITLIFNQENRGFAAANNQGLARASGDYLVLLNNDTVLPRGWLSRLIHNLENDPEIGMIGPVTNNVWNEARQEAGYRDLGGLVRFAQSWGNEHEDQIYPIDVLAMYCVALPRAVYAKVGELDERYGIGMFEDDDYAHRIRAAGYRVSCAEEAYIHHAGRASFRKLADVKYRALHEDNRKIYEEKWCCNWRPHEGNRYDTARFVAEIAEKIATGPGGEVVIFPPNIGWAIDLFQRPHQLALALGQMGHLVFFCLHDYDDAEGPRLREIAPNVILSSVPLCAFDGVRSPVVFAMPYNGYESAYFRKARVIYESVDVLEVFGGDQEHLQREHDRLIRESDLVVATADQLAQEIIEVRPDVLLVPNGVDFAHFAKENVAPEASIQKLPGPVIGYFGALARWVDYELIRRTALARPGWSFVLVGPDHDGTAAASGLDALPNVHLTGPRPYADLPAILAAFDVATIPFIVNDLTNAVSPLKLFEYMAGGCPTVTTAMRECRKETSVRIAQSDADWLPQLETAVAEGRSPQRVHELRHAAERHTWQARASAMLRRVAITENV